MKASTLYLIFIPVVLVMVAGILLFPDLASRWTDYNLLMLSRIVHRIVPFFFIHVGLAVGVLILEAYVVGWRQSSLYQFLRPDKSAVVDLVIFFVNALQLDYVLVFILTLGVFHKLKLGLTTGLGLEDGVLAMVGTPALQVILYIIIADFVVFIEHLAHHKLSFLWPFHSFHHSATELNVLTAQRGHPIQSEFTNVLIAIVPLTIIGFPLVSLLLYRIVRNTVTFMHHSRLTWDWGWIGKYFLVSPAYHRIHHSVLEEHQNKNLSILFPVWDHMFGTFYKGDIAAKEMGFPGNPYHKKSFFDDILVPFRMLGKKAEAKAKAEENPNF
ncbi:MAG TPA: sterol desaturase family protein [Saprospiraceae bacterium]|nr:sterol desaturase family protein [Saprospiraceae bacterium]